MIKHIVMFNHADGFTPAENTAHAQKLKHNLEALSALPGVLEMKVRINEIPYSNMDVMLDSLFEDEAALLAYKSHPAHHEVVKFIESAFKNRACFDYKI